MNTPVWHPPHHANKRCYTSVFHQCHTSHGWGTLVQHGIRPDKTPLGTFRQHSLSPRSSASHSLYHINKSHWLSIQCQSTSFTTGLEPTITTYEPPKHFKNGVRRTDIRSLSYKWKNPGNTLCCVWAWNVPSTTLEDWKNQSHSNRWTGPTRFGCLQYLHIWIKSGCKVPKCQEVGS